MTSGAEKKKLKWVVWGMCEPLVCRVSVRSFVRSFVRRVRGLSCVGGFHGSHLSQLFSFFSSSPIPTGFLFLAHW